MTSWISGIAIVVVVSLLIALPVLWTQAFGKASPKSEAPPPRLQESAMPVVSKKPDAGANAASAITREELAKRLAALPAKSDKPLEPGAMCYSMAPRPPTAHDYICPKDGHRTQYAKGQMSELLASELPEMRETIKRIKNLNVSLDESELCRRCKPKVSEPSVTLVVRHSDGKEQRTPHPTTEDVQLLADFLEGRTIHTGPTGRETLLKELEKHLAKLLGL